MTDLLRKAFDAASRLPEDKQGTMSEWLPAELASDEGWEGRFTKTQGALSALIQEMLNEHERSDIKESCF